MDTLVKSHAFKYAVVRFVPFSETEEFVNIGIVIACPALRHFDFLLQQKRRHGRVTDFFPDVGRESYKEAIEMFSRELSRVQNLINGSPDISVNQIRQLFDSLVQPREAMIQFSRSRVRMASDPKAALRMLFSYYVERNFVTQEYKEQILERKVRNIVHSLNLPAPFKAQEIGDDFTAAHFPLVQQIECRPIKAIKPFYLGQDDPSKIITHGGFWVDRIRRMRSRKLLPEEVLFAVEGPSPGESKRYAAFQEICSDLNHYDVQTTPSTAEHEIISFAEREIPDIRVNLLEDFEVDYWTNQLGVTRDQLASAIDRVGPSAKSLRDFFNRKLI